ncbi:ABC-2 type transport system permease protein [Spirosomataceae bacterium TFI 002]|nr:ABC-2 type transport system permease protein [Spirosomataceae bacterium TFI 002]
MKNIILILKREYLTRVKKRSFIVMTLLFPIIIGGVYGIAIWAVLQGTEVKNINIVDDSTLFINKFENSESYNFSYLSESIDEAKLGFKASKADALVHIPAEVIDNPKNVQIFAERGVPLELQSKIERSIEKEIEGIKLAEAGITQSVLKSAKMNVNSETISLKDGNEKRSSSGGATAAGFICGFMIYMAVFIYGAQVMRGVMEEKTSRIVEVIISSVKPFQLMLGKILGVALVGLTQFGLWITLSAAVIGIGSKFIVPKITEAQEKMTSIQMESLPPEARQIAMEQAQDADVMSALPDIFQVIDTLPLATILISFLFYFFGGYMLYSSLFGAVGSAVDSETDTQQFMLPITIPIIASFLIAQFVMRDPNGSLAFWFSMIPLTSPIIMMVRIPFGVPIWEIVLSITLLIGGFIFTTWLAGRIYRVGILMYGKKPTWRELGKWVFYKG